MRHAHRMEPKTKRLPGRPKSTRPSSIVDVERLKALRAAGLSLRACAQEFDVSAATIQYHIRRWMAETTSTQKANVDRFWSNVAVGSADECWEWTGYRQRGYGRFGGYAFAHRHSYMLANGPIPAGLFILHSCDNPPCVNPAHLRAGTAQDNANDIAKHGRRRKYGDDNARFFPKANQLTWEQADDVKASFFKGEPIQSIATRMAATEATISGICYGSTWRESQRPPQFKRFDGSHVHQWIKVKNQPVPKGRVMFYCECLQVRIMYAPLPPVEVDTIEEAEHYMEWFNNADFFADVCPRYCKPGT